MGVQVPGVPEEEGRVAGLLFADDLVGLASTRRQLQRQADRVERVVRHLGDECGHPEVRSHVRGAGGQGGGSGAPGGGTHMHLGAGGAGGGRVHIPGADLPAGPRPPDDAGGAACQGQAGLGHDAALLGHGLGPAGGAGGCIPVSDPRHAALRGRAVGHAAAAHAAGADVAQPRAARAGGGKETDTSLPVGALWREMGVAPVHAQAAARRARAINKFGHLQTWIAVLVEHPARLRKRTWVSGALQWMRTFHRGLLWVREYEDQRALGQPEGAPGRRAHAQVMEETWRAWRRAGASGLVALWRRGFKATAWAAPGAVPAWARRAQPALGVGYVRCTVPLGGYVDGAAACAAGIVRRAVFVTLSVLWEG